MAEWISPDRERNFPKLDRSHYEKTSDETDRNNCAAWAHGDSALWMQPPAEPWHYWPRGAPLTFDSDSFIRAYELLGWELCDDALPELGYKKLAIYEHPNGEFAHAAQLNRDGSCSSKLGDWEDIRHDTLDVLEELAPHPAYGRVKYFMRYKISNA
jgi:hypothetical protein